MAADSQLILPGDFDPAKTYVLSGATLKAWRANLLADRVIVGPGLKESDAGPDGRVIGLDKQPTEAAEPVNFPFKMIYSGSGQDYYVANGNCGIFEELSNSWASAQLPQGSGSAFTFSGDSLMCIEAVFTGGVVSSVSWVNEGSEGKPAYEIVAGEQTIARRYIAQLSFPGAPIKYFTQSHLQWEWYFVDGIGIKILKPY